MNTPNNQQGQFNEESLLQEIINVWGEYGAHADVCRGLIKRATHIAPDTPEGISPEEVLEKHCDYKMNQIDKYNHRIITPNQALLAMLEYASLSRQRSGDLVEITDKDIAYWNERGKYYGYPQCCIDYFVNHFPNVEDTPEYIHKGTGFIPCPYHQNQILEKETTLAGIIKDRKHPLPFPRDDNYFEPSAKEEGKEIALRIKSKLEEVFGDLDDPLVKDLPSASLVTGYTIMGVVYDALK